MTSEWITINLDVRAMPKAGWWSLLAVLIFNYAGDFLEVPVGTETDLASIPRILKSFVSVNGKHRRAAVLHDYLYENKMFTRKQCDEIFYVAMRECGMNKWGAKIMWRGVRMGGWTRGNW